MSPNVVPAVRSNPLHEGVHSTSAGSPPPPTLPPLSNEAMLLVAPFFREGADWKATVGAIVDQESRPAAQALSWLGAVLREGARATHGSRSDELREWASQLQQLSETMSKLVDAKEADATAKFVASVREQFSEFYAMGYERGAKDALTKLAEDSSKPVVRRVKTVHEDSAGHVTSIEEHEYHLKEIPT